MTMDLIPPLFGKNDALRQGTELAAAKKPHRVLVPMPLRSVFDVLLVREPMMMDLIPPLFGEDDALRRQLKSHIMSWFQCPCSPCLVLISFSSSLT